MNIADLTEFKELSFEEAENVSGRGTRFLILVKLAPPDSIYLFSGGSNPLDGYIQENFNQTTDERFIKKISVYLDGTLGDDSPSKIVIYDNSALLAQSIL